MLKSDRPLWQANYKSMNPTQLVAELEQIAKRPAIYDDRIERKAFIADELAVKAHHSGPIILMESD
jgi:hypothetical protein